MDKFWELKPGDEIRLTGKRMSFIRHVSLGEAKALMCPVKCLICEAMSEVKMHYLIEFKKDVWRRPAVVSGKALADGVTNDKLLYLAGDRVYVTDLYRKDLDEMGAEYEVLDSVTHDEHKAIVTEELKKRGLEV